ncbi:MAG: TadE/TadG family type IV pilus assembly protein [Pelolinea sp.]|nr:TadE/TadG family type IV pilus assembly protein [Pelolinea sp.]
MVNKTKYNQLKYGSPPGQAAIEFALMLPILLVLIICGLEFGRLFYTKIVITNAAREGAYYLSTHQSDYNYATGSAPNTVIAAQTEANNSGISAITVGITPNNCCIQGEYSMKITVETKVQDLLILSFLGNAFSITATNHDEFPLSSSVEMMVQ